MKRLLIALLCVCTVAMHVYAGEKFLHFSGNITSINGDNRNIEVKNDRKKSRNFFVAGQVLQGKRTVGLDQIIKGCSVTVTYQKNRSRLIANQVTILGCDHAKGKK